jgi:hypothetical protein
MRVKGIIGQPEEAGHSGTIGSVFLTLYTITDVFLCQFTPPLLFKLQKQGSVFRLKKVHLF